jgi:hypothetical protein
MAACVSSSEDPQAGDASPEVKGRRIERGNDNENNDGNGTSDPSNNDEGDETAEGDGNDGPESDNPDDEPSDAPEDDADPDGDATADEDPAPGSEGDDVAVAPPAPEQETVTFVTREVTLNELDIEVAASQTGTSGSYVWDASTRSIGSVTSALPAAGTSPTTSIVLGQDTVVARVRLENPYDARRLHVEGRLIHTIESGGATTQLASDPIDVVLAPNGATSATFEYLVPSGTYSFTGSYLAH